MGFSTFIFILTVILSWASRKNYQLFSITFIGQIRDFTISQHLCRQTATLSQKRTNVGSLNKNLWEKEHFVVVTTFSRLNIQCLHMCQHGTWLGSNCTCDLKKQKAMLYTGSEHFMYEQATPSRSRKAMGHVGYTVNIQQPDHCTLWSHFSILS